MLFRKIWLNEEEKVNGERLALNEMVSTKRNLISEGSQEALPNSPRNNFFDLSSSAMLHLVFTRPKSLSHFQ